MDNITSPNEKPNDEDFTNVAPIRPSSAERVRNLGTLLDEKARDTATAALQKAEDAGVAVGDGLRSLGHTVREQGPEGGVAGEAVSAVADALEGSGRYLQEEKLKDVAKDITDVIRRNPIPALLLGIAAGFLAGRALTPRS